MLGQLILRIRELHLPLPYREMNVQTMLVILTLEWVLVTIKAMDNVFLTTGWSISIQDWVPLDFRKIK